MNTFNLKCRGYPSGNAQKIVGSKSGTQKNSETGTGVVAATLSGAMRTVFAQKSYKGEDGNVILRNVWNCSIGRSTGKLERCQSG